MPDRLVKGTHIAPLLEHARDDPGRAGRFFDALGQTTNARELDGVERGGWYSVPLVSRVWTAWAEASSDDVEARYEAMIDAGRLIANEATNTFMRLLIKLMTPKLLASKWPDFWRKSHNFGAMDADTSKLAENQLTLNVGDVGGYAYIGPCAVGFIAHAFGSMGVKNASVCETRVPHDQVTANNYDVEIRW